MKLTDKEFVNLLSNLMDDPGEEVLGESYQKWKNSDYSDDLEGEEELYEL